MRKNILLFITLFSFVMTSYSQNNSYVNADKGASYDTGGSNGKNIEIPLYTAKIDGVTLPIYLSYNNTGMKVNNVPSSVGLNWKLNAGGEIRKHTNHIVDESENGWFFNYELDDYQTGVFHIATSYVKDLFRYKDAAPDMFYMNMSNGDFANFFYEYKFNELGNYISPFLFNQSKNINQVHINFDLLKQYRYHRNTEFLYENDVDADIKISDNSGVNYSFRKGAKRERPWDLKRRYTSYIDSADYKNYYIHKITTDVNNEVVDFEYTENKLFKFTPHVKATRRQTNNDPQTPPSQNDAIVTEGYYYDVSVEDISRKEIKRIITNNETIEFIYKEVNYVNSLEIPEIERPPASVYDALQNQTLKLVDEINIYDYKGDYIFGYKFNYTEQTQDQNLFEGLFKLKSIFKYGKNHKDYVVFKKFDYYHDGSPSSIISKAQDVFGYSNNTTNNNETNFTPVQIYQGVADRMPNENALIEGMLKSVTSQSGGKTEYIYRENKYEEMYYGGLLVDQVLSYDNSGTLASKLMFSYENPEGYGLPIYNIPIYGQGVTPTNLYEDGYYEGYQDAWQTYFTKKDPLMDFYNYQFLTSYNVSNSPYDLLKKTPLTDQLVLNLGLQNFKQIDTGVFYTKVTQTKINVINDSSEMGYIEYHYEPAITNFTLSKMLKKVVYFNSLDEKVKETIYNNQTINYGYVNTFRFDNTHLQSNNADPTLYRYVIKTNHLYKIKNIIKDVERKEYDESGNYITYRTEYTYLNEDDNDINTTDYSRVKESIKYFNNIPYEKSNFKYLSEYQNIPDYYQNLRAKNPLIEDYTWVKSPNNWKLAFSKIITYLPDGKISKLSEYIGHKGIRTYYDDTNFTWSYFDANGSLISPSEDIIEYTYDQEGKLVVEKNIKSQISKIYQRSDEYTSLYVDATLVTDKKYNSENTLFIKKSFENENNNPYVIKFNRAFSGENVYTGESISLGVFPADSQISYWSFSNGKWQYHSHDHQGGNVTIYKPENALYIDELRVQPNDSYMTTSTFIPLVGVSSALNDIGKGTRTEFDLFGRKLYDLDQGNNVLKEYRYNTIYIQTNN